MIDWMLIAVLACVLCGLIVASARWHQSYTDDHDAHLPQKIHSGVVPRIGGVAILLAFIAGVFAPDLDAVTTLVASKIMILGAPAILLGFLEDITKAVRPLYRMGGMVLSACALVVTGHLSLDLQAHFGAHAWVNQLGWLGVVLPVLGIVGVTNAFNLIDGLNGLSSGVVTLALATLAWLAASHGDQVVLDLAVALAAATLGFWAFNVSTGRIFLGDGGAYMLGMATSALSLVLLLRNPGISPFVFPLLFAYPVVETLFVMARRHLSGVSIVTPDRMHLHHIVFDCVCQRVQVGEKTRHLMATSLLMGFAGIPMAVAACFPADHWVLLASMVIQGASYLVLFGALMKTREEQEPPVTIIGNRDV